MMNYAKAATAFVKALFRPRGPVAAHSVNGHAVLTGWDRVPEEDLIGSLAKQRQVDALTTPRLALYGYGGPHAGEVFFLAKPLETIARHSSADVVVTPERSRGKELYRVQLNGNAVMTAEQGATFKINGAVETRSELFDYDEVEMFDNRFLVLDLTVGRNAPRGK